MKVPLEHGLHARPAAVLVARLKHLAATVSISAHGKSANARSAIALMGLGVRRGDEIAVSAYGPDAEAAVAAVRAAVSVAEDRPASAAANRRDADHGEAVKDGGISGDDAAPDALIRAVTAVPGFAVGRAYHLVRRDIEVAEHGAGAATERARLDAAIATVRAKVQALAANDRGPGRDVLTAHLELLDDPELIDAASASIAQDKSAGFAWRQAVRANVDLLRALPDARMAERAADLLDVESQVLTALDAASPTSNAAAVGGQASSGTAESDAVGQASRQPTSASQDGSLPAGSILLADELLPSQFVALDASRIAGICTARGGPTSHVAILAAAVNIPMLVAAGSAISNIPNDVPLILDADNGTLRISPPESERADAEAKVTRRRERRESERLAAQRECRTADGTRIEIFANVGSVADARTAVTQGAEGCGLLRTEFLFLDRDTAPDEATQSALYSGIVSAFDGRPVVIRTLDSGGDKPLAYMPLPTEENPALGVRGVRISLLYPDVLRAQLRAILAAQPRGRCRILLPMISDPAEVRAVGEMLDDVRRELGHDASVPLGAMIETPAAAMLADQIAREADFLSIGTNDLTQYALAIDRGNPTLAARLDSLHPAVLRLIAATAEGGRLNRRDVAVCGGLASDPAAAPILIGLGVNELSAVAGVIPRIKALIATLKLEDCQELARGALEQQTAAQVRALVAKAGWLE